MSQIGAAANIAASVSQGALQQHQAARARDSQQSRAGRLSQQLREATLTHIESVEDSRETSDDHLTVDEDAHHGGHQYLPLTEQPEENPAEDEPTEPAEVESEDPPPTGGRIDLTA